MRYDRKGGAWRSLVARLLREQEVPSSNLGAPTIPPCGGRQSEVPEGAARLRGFHLAQPVAVTPAHPVEDIRPLRGQIAAFADIRIEPISASRSKSPPAPSSITTHFHRPTRAPMRFLRCRNISSRGNALSPRIAGRQSKPSITTPAGGSAPDAAANGRARMKLRKRRSAAPPTRSDAIPTLFAGAERARPSSGAPPQAMDRGIFENPRKFGVRTRSARLLSTSQRSAKGRTAPKIACAIARPNAAPTQK